MTEAVPAGRPDWHRNLPVLASTQLLTVTAMSAVLPFLPFFIRELGVTDRADVERWSGLIFSGPFLAAALMSPVWGYLGDRYGHRPMVIRAVFGLAVMNVAYCFVQTPMQFWILRLLQGMVTGFIPASLAITSATTPAEELPGAMGKLQASASAGRLLGPALGGLLAGVMPFRGIFLLVGSAILLAAIGVVLWLKEPARAPMKARTSPLTNLKFAVADVRMRAALAGLFVTMIAASLAMPVFPLYVEDLLAGTGDPAWWTGVGFGVVALFSMIGAAMIGRLAETIGLKVLLVLALVLTSGALGAHALVRGLPALLAVRAALGLGFAGIQPVLLSMISRRAPAGHGGGITGLASAASILGFFVGPIAGGWLAGYVGAGGTFVLAGAIMIVCAMLAAIFARQLHRDRQVLSLPDPLPR